MTEGVRLAQLVKASAGQADVQRFESHLRHNWLRCGALWAPSGTNLQAKLAFFLGLVAIQKWSIYKVYLKRRGQLLF